MSIVISPTREQEKKELARLNDILAGYIDHVDSREIVDRRYEEIVTNVKVRYKQELEVARTSVGETFKENARLQIEVDQYKREAAEYKDRYIKCTKEAEDYERSLLLAEAQINEIQARLNDAINERKHYENVSKKLKKEFDALEQQLAQLKHQLETEAVIRIDLETSLQSMKEELSFQEREQNELRISITRDLNKVETLLLEEYKGKLADALHDLREENDEQIRLTREKAERIFNAKLEELRSLSEKHDGARESALREMRILRTRCDDLSAQVSRLGSENAVYESRIKESEERSRQETENHEALRTKYSDLLDIKIQLDAEIAAYRKMLESGINRFKQSTPPRGNPDVFSRKRKRVAVSGRGTGALLHQSAASAGYTTKTSAKGHVVIQETSEDGRYIKLHNTSDGKDQPIGGWELKHTVGDEDTTFKFYRSASVKAGQTVTVWSSNSETTHRPPSDLVMKNKTWLTGDQMQTLLLNTGGDVIATCDMERSQGYTSITQCSSDSSDENDSGYPEEEGNSSWFGRIFHT